MKPRHDRQRSEKPSFFYRVILTTAMICVASTAANQAMGIDIETIFQTDPPFREIQEVVRPWPKRQQLWLQVLTGSEVELQIKAAEAIALAHQRGVPNMAEAVPQLISVLNGIDAHPLLRLAVVRALVVLDAREAAEILMNHAQRAGATQAEMAELIEPALARWGHASMREIWHERLRESRPTGRLIVLAIRAAGSTNLTVSVPRLRELVTDRALTPEVRLESARALISIQPDGLEREARQILDGRGSDAPVESLVAAVLMSRHSSPAGVGLLQELAGNREPAVIAIAIKQLLEIDPMHVESMNTRITAHADTNVRRLAVRILQGQQTVSAVTLLGTMLNDVHPTVRKMAQESLISLDQVQQLRPNVREVAMQMLATDQWRGLEQAALFVGGVDHEPAAARLVELLKSDHPQVPVAAAWALRRLLVPETVQPIFETLRTQTEKYPHAPPSPDWDEKKVAAVYKQRGHLIEALTLMRHRDIVPLLLPCLPTPPVPPGAYPEAHELRVQAIWALGHIFQDDPQLEIVARLAERLKTPDGAVVRGKTLIQAMAAVSLGRMNSVESMDLLRGLYTSGDKYSDLKYGCAWAVSRMTNEPLPEFDMIRMIGHSSSFLDPLDE